MFTLHPQLANDCIPVTDLPLCKLLLINDANYPWCILVPRRNNISEIFQLSIEDQLQHNKESTWLAKTMMELFHADKMNVAALGNMVPQLHIHHIARFKTDPAWPGPVWGKVAAKNYNADAAEKIIASLNRGFTQDELDLRQR